MTIKHLYPDSRPTLDLNFARDKVLDPRITYSRSSSGTYVNSAGVITSAGTDVARFDHSPSTLESLGLLVEEARTNLVTYSENLNDPNWTTLNASVTPNAYLAPNGTFGAVKLVEDTANADHMLITPNQSGSGTVTSSVYLRGAERVEAQLTMSDFLTGGVFLNINLSTGAATSTSTGNWTAPSYSVTSAGNGWYRVSVTGTRGGSGTIRSQIRIVSSGNTTYTGNGTSGIYVWGAQLEAGSFPTSYIPTPATFTSRASTATYYDANGVIQTAGIDVARSNAYFPDSNGVMQPAGLLLEAAGTNRLLNSGNLTISPWAWTNNTGISASIVSNSSTAPDGTVTAAEIQFPLFTDTFTYINRVQNFTAANTSYVFSIWLKAASSGDVGKTIRLQIFQTGTTVVYKSHVLTSNWVRVSTSSKTLNAGTAAVQIEQVVNQAAVNVLAWGAQVETGSLATSYIPTAGSTVTRAADVSTSSTVTRSADVAQMTGANFSSWYNQSEGTVFGSFKTNSTNTSMGLFAVYQTSAPTTNRISLRPRSSFTDTAGSQQFLFSGVSVPTNQQTKMAWGFGSTATLCKDGVLIGTDSSVVLSSVLDKAIIGHIETANPGLELNGTISRLTYYPTRLSDTILQTITSS